MLKNPRVALGLGIATVHQQNRVVPSMSVMENLELGDEPTRTPLRWLSRTARPDAVDALEFVGMADRASATVGSLSLADRQLVSIARAVSRGSRLLVFDEPTAALSPLEARYLFGVVERLRAAGTALLYVTHRLQELPEVVDRVMVMRDGRVVATRATDVSERELVELMAGAETIEHDKELVTERRQVTAHQRQDESALLSVSRLSDREGSFEDITFDVRSGEILGILGLPDSGAIQVAQAIAGARRYARGAIRINGSDVRYSSPRGAIRVGVGYLAGDRAQKGVLPNFSVRDTITLSALPRTSRGGLLRFGTESELTRGLVADCQVRAASTALPMTALSGGNQQKALFARLLGADPRLIVCEDATSGVDVAGRESIYDLITTWCERGNGALWQTSDLRELATICDRVLVLREGTLVRTLTKNELSVDRLMAAQFAQPGSGKGANPAPSPASPAHVEASGTEASRKAKSRGEK